MLTSDELYVILHEKEKREQRKEKRKQERKNKKKQKDWLSKKRQRNLSKGIQEPNDNKSKDTVSTLAISSDATES